MNCCTSTDHTPQDPAFFAPERLRELQDRLLREHVAWLAARSPFYGRKFQEAGLNVEAIRGVEDLPQLPLTRKTDLDASGDGFLCVPRKEVVDVCLTSGTTASPVALLQTRQDLERLGRNEERGFRTAGITCADRVMVCAAMDRCFMAGLAYFLGLTRIGAEVVRAGSSSLPVAMDLVLGQRPSTIVGVPTLLKTIAERLLAAGHRPRELGVHKLVCIGEPVREPDFSLSPLGLRIHELWDAQVLGTYASTELATGFTECEHGAGGHLSPDLAIIEILDQKGRAVPPGQPGEVVATPLGVTGMPLLRFCTGDIAVQHEAPCACGRLAPRLGPILGRKNQVLKYRGTTVFPNAIFTALQEMPGIQGYYLEVRDEYDLSDQITVVVGAADSSLPPSAVQERIAARVRVKPAVRLEPPEAVAARIFPADKRKPVHFFDLRRKAAQSDDSPILPPSLEDA